MSETKEMQEQIEASRGGHITESRGVHEPISREIGSCPPSAGPPSAGPPSQEPPSDKRFKTTVTLLLAGLTFITSLIIILNVRASNRAAAATRDGRLLGIRYLSQLGRSFWDAAVEKDLINSFQEVSGLMMQAQVYQNMARGANDAAFYKMMQETMAKSQAQILSQGVVTKPPYFTPGYNAFNYFQYVIDHVTVPAGENLEHQDQKWKESAFWSGKSDAYTTGLAIMAVAVFLLTLSLVLHAHIRFIMAGVGVFLLAGVLTVVGLTTLRHWHGYADESMRLYAKAAGTALTAQLVINWNGDTALAESYALEAKADIDKIVKVDPDYMAAILLRARVHNVLGEAQFYAGKKGGGAEELAGAAADLDRAIAGGKTEGYVYWSKGYTNFVLSRYPESVAALDRALALLPEQKFSLGFVKAASLLYAGRIDEARALTEEAIEFGLKKPLGADTMNLRTIIKNLERFNELRSLLARGSFPRSSTVEVDPQLKPGAPAAAYGLQEMILRLKEAGVCLSILNKARPADVKAEITTPRFVAPVYDQAGNIVDTPATDELKSGTARAYFQIELKGMEKGQSIVRKVYRRAPGQVFWIEQLWLGRAEHWEGPTEAKLMASVENRIPEAGETLLAGDYRLEIFIDGALKATGSFKVL
jgi:tetratricopeptide (TPR) repeat protein